jgi:hypothetical protein
LLEIQGTLFVLEFVLGVAAEEGHHVAHGQLAGGGFALNGHVGQLALAILKIDDTFFDSAFNDHPVDLHVDRLIEAVNAVDGLFFDELSRKSANANYNFNTRS